MENIKIDFEKQVAEIILEMMLEDRFISQDIYEQAITLLSK